MEHMFDTMTDRDLVAAARGLRATADRAEAELLVVACAWADAHPAEPGAAASYVIPGCDDSLTIAGPGCPEVSEFSISEFASASV